MKNVPALLLMMAIFMVSDVHSRNIEPFNLRGFLQRVIKTNLEDAQNPWKIGEIKTGCDVYDWCSYYKNHCSHPTVRTYCKGTCGLCAPQTTTKPAICKDTIASCDQLKKYCTREDYKEHIGKLCPSTCGVCGDQLACGVAKRRSGKANPIVGGSEPEKGFYPWQVAIYFGGNFLCGGSLIDNKRVITAAHCFKYLSKDTSLYKIVLGDHNRASNEGTEETRQVVRITQHKDYKHESDTHDVALLVMDKQVVFGADINAICLPADNEVLPVGSKCFMSGWGRMHNSGTTVQRLQHVALPIVHRNHCVQRNRFNGHVVNDQMICAGYNDGVNYSSGCHGDSGGPLACQQPDGRWKLFGVTSWGSPQCNGLDRYTVFSRVSKYTKWIREQPSN